MVGHSTPVLGMDFLLSAVGDKQMLIQPFDREELRERFLNASPFPSIKIDNFLDPAFAKEVAAAYPDYNVALGEGVSFKSVNERRKVQLTDASKFPEPIARLNDALAAPEFLDDLSYITDIPKLLADEKLAGGGIHMTGPGGRLDVHVDFNYMEDRKLHRRLNLLIYLNPVWEARWGGHIQLWDKDVKVCEQEYVPAFNRCVMFMTNDISYHGVTPINPEAPYARQSFATYYYTREAPSHWTGVSHSTIFKARPEERIRRYLLMPAEGFKRGLVEAEHQVKRGVKRLLGR